MVNRLAPATGGYVTMPDVAVVKLPEVVVATAGPRLLNDVAVSMLPPVGMTLPAREIAPVIVAACDVSAMLARATAAREFRMREFIARGDSCSPIASSVP